MIQNAVVFLVVACAAWTVAVRYMPGKLRHLTWQHISDVARRLGWLRIAAHADRKSAAAPACASGCKQCNGCDTSAPTTTAVQFIAPPRRMKGTVAK